MKVVNPATERVIKNIKIDDPLSIELKYQLAVQAQKKSVRADIAKRLETVAHFEALLLKQETKLASLLTSEMGKPINQAIGEIRGARLRIAYFLENSERVLAEEVVLDDGHFREVIAHEPLGVIANISAWNYPYLIGVNVFVPALIAGNAVLYKPSEYTTLTGLEFQKLWAQSGLAPGLFQTVTGGGEVGKQLLELPLDGYYFTGSPVTGKFIYEQVAKKMVPCQMELGGKDPMYVTANNHNLGQVANSAVEGVYYNNGQSCCAVERIYVHQDVYHDFINLFVKEVKQMKMGDPMNEEVFIGPLARKEQMAYLQAQVDDAVANGGKVLSGGKAETRKGYYFQPTVIINASHHMKIMTEESFGPIIGIQMVKSDQEAIELMKDSAYGLAASVFSDDQAQALEIMDQMKTGTVYWNCSDRISPRLPWSGRKKSGIGVTLSEAGIRAFTLPKAYHLRSKT